MSDAADPGGQAAAVAARPSAAAVARRTVTRAWADNIVSQSAAAAFWQALALPPLLLALLGSIGVVAPGTVASAREELLHVAGGVFNREAFDQIIVPTVDSALATGRSELAGIGFLLSLWSGSAAMSSFVDAITRAHRQYGVRNPVWQRTLSLLLYLGGLIGGIVALPMLALGPDKVTGLLPDAWQAGATSLIGWLYYPVLGAGTVLALTTLYRLALPAKPPWQRGLPGALLAAAVFLLGATGLRVYLGSVSDRDHTYGALASPIAFLLGAFLIGFSIVVGAHLNAALQDLRPVPLRDRRGALDRSVPGPAASDQDVSDQDVPDPAVSDQAVPDQAVPGQAVPDPGAVIGGDGSGTAPRWPRSVAVRARRTARRT